jgi:hypothetical protein
MKYNSLIEKYQKEIAVSPKLIGESALSDLFQTLLKGEKAQTKTQTTATYTYRLDNPNKNLPILREKLPIDKVDKTKPLQKGQTVTGVGGTGARLTKGNYIVIQDKGTSIDIQPLADTGKPYGKIITITRNDINESFINEAVATQPTSIYDNNGKIINSKGFSIIFYNAFSNSENGLVTIENLLFGRIGGDKRVKEFGVEEISPPKDKVNESIIKFIKQYGLNDIITAFDTYEKAQKGNIGTRAGMAIRTGLKTGVDMLSKNGVNYI